MKTCSHNKRIGLTSTVPVEIIFASGLEPVDINNIFIESKDPEGLVTQAESAGFSSTLCSWIKGIYSTVINHDIRSVVAVTGGDCSNTIALAEIMSIKGVDVIPFDYPHSQNPCLVNEKLEAFRKTLGTSWNDIKREKRRLDKIRKKLREIDRLTYIDNIVTGLENHIFLVSSSDFKSDPEKYENEIDRFLHDIKGRKEIKTHIRLGMLGVPPIFSNFYEYMESIGARVVFNEVQRQFSMPYDTDDIVEQYTIYTYPYSSEARIKDIEDAVKERELDGLIHYTQTFCYRQLYDIILRERLNIPILTIEGDRPGEIDRRTALRLDAFVEML
ncbi:MAG: 2-hydroxyacyl-CoA dehydratase, partial [Deltaproteobacteria bacterium]|nr:2-hydroxyacyl-CoA dehydratase [Deltaproteobacteria bacterium]